MKIPKYKIRSFLKRMEYEDGHWMWRGGIYKSGYGEAKLDGKQITAHRLFYLIYRGDIPENKCVLHTCDIRNCVNPNHLYLGDRKQNSRDMVSRNRSLKGEKQPMSKLTEDNICEIKLLKAMKFTVGNIAKRFKVSHSLISMILSGKRWGWM